MFLPTRPTEIIVCTERVDFRKSYDGLSGVIRNHLETDPNSRALFVFMNRRGDQVKIFWVDSTGTCIWMKRLDRGTFKVPTSPSKRATITISELSRILDGVRIAAQNCESKSAQKAA